MGRSRVRQHVNPLTDKYQQVFEMPGWEGIYADLAAPLHLDIGCARGRFILDMAQRYPERNFLGIEIRDPLVKDANDIRDRLQLKNLHYLFANINTSLQALLESLPAESLHWITIQFPDPWFKKRHHKRRVVQPDLVDILARHTPADTVFFLQSDVEEVAREMREKFLEHPLFETTHDEYWLSDNIFEVPTEREVATQNKGEPVYRVLLQKVPSSDS
ncbi:tRNA (guanine-N(7)-)-methyltransferase [[Leptolyngbya] sp. PCC 7376]|uniref:tRNA (guanosine(46)-N7)-methyltransferase TrmB n=1 Tax=[Leptolyngbya] sp. PCC 7376 TaxID=111781 RepID=UPI00029ED05A|nr:tRNA (guanosine(46)-N7)-methyltransferase TrmB [[Leptolyngbya] sp. PCC 7376]AFY38283.1 tRNA (guanine-N(7)-)-methyltransferase [[Leptolyngbya] sp. PCC 7376]